MAKGLHYACRIAALYMATLPAQNKFCFAAEDNCVSGTCEGARPDSRVARSLLQSRYRAGPAKKARHLLNTNVSVAALQRAAESLTSNFTLDLLQQADARFEQEPAGINGYIKNELLPQAEVTKAQLQGEVDRTAQAVRNCHEVLQNSEKVIREQESALFVLEGKHKECEGIQEEKKKFELERCGELDSYARSLGSPQPDLESVLTQQTTVIEDALRRAKEFFDDRYPKFVEKKNACNEAKDGLDAQQQQCKSDKLSMERVYCEIHSRRAAACQDYGSCYDAKSKHFDKVVEHVKILEQHTKDTFKTLSCFHEGFTDGDSETPSQDECDNSGVDTGHLDVSYPIKPQQEDCSSEVKTDFDYSLVKCPGEDGNMGDVPIEQDVEEVLVTAAPTDAPIGAVATTAAPNDALAAIVAPANDDSQSLIGTDNANTSLADEKAAGEKAADQKAVVNTSGEVTNASLFADGNASEEKAADEKAVDNADEGDEGIAGDGTDEEDNGEEQDEDDSSGEEGEQEEERTEDEQEKNGEAAADTSAASQ